MPDTIPNIYSLRKHALVALGLGMLVGLAYSNSFQSGFVLDNEFIIKEDTRLRALSWENVKLIFTEDYWFPKGVGGLFRPMTTLSFLFDYSICGHAEDPTHYHWINNVVHLVNACLVYLLMTRLSSGYWVAIAAASIFAVHPIATESVTNLVGRSDLLATLSVLTALLLYIRSTQVTSKGGWLWLSLMAMMAVVGVLSKESALVIAGLVPLYDVVFRLREDNPSGENFLTWFGQQFVQRYIVFVPIVIGVFLLRQWMLQENGPTVMAWGDNPLRATDYLSARLTAVKIIVYYLGLLVFPLRLCCDYTLNAIPISSWRMTAMEDWKAVAALIFLILLALMAWKSFRDGKRAEVFFIAWFFLALLPTSNVLFLIDSNMAERFLYLPLVGFVGWAATILDSWVHRIKRPGLYLLLVPMIGWLGIRTYIRNDDWRSNLTLWSSASKVCPESFRVQRSLAWAMYMSDHEHPNLDAIIQVAERAATIARLLPTDQGDEKSHLYLGMFYGLKADAMITRDPNGHITLNDESRQLFERSMVELEYAAIIGERQVIHQKQQRLAIGWSEDDIGIVGPKQVYENLWVTYSRLGRHVEAATVLRKIQVLNPLTPAVYQALPDELALAENYREAGVVLIQAMLLGLNAEIAMNQLAFVYDRVNTSPIPPLIQVEQQTRWNIANPYVREDVDNAFVQLIELFLLRKHLTGAAELRAVSKNFDCDPVRIEALFKPLDSKRNP